ncbi:uncharacterized LabA/DUF88 family protein [Bradyrhizobium sp. USDA 4518]
MTEDREYSTIRPLLDDNGYALVAKLIKESVYDWGRRKAKADMDVEFAVDAVELAERVDRIILRSRNSDGRRLVEAVGCPGVRVFAICTSLADRRPSPMNFGGRWTNLLT